MSVATGVRSPVGSSTVLSSAAVTVWYIHGVEIYRASRVPMDWAGGTGENLGKDLPTKRGTVEREEEAISTFGRGSDIAAFRCLSALLTALCR